MHIELGKIVGVWGVKGWVKLHSYTRNREDIADYKSWILGSEKFATDGLGGEKYQVAACRPQGRTIVANLEGVNDRDAALALSGQHIFIDEHDLPVLDEGEYYWHQLIGLEVVNLDGDHFGTVDSLFETGANDVLVVKPSLENGVAEKKISKRIEEILIPHVDQVVKEVDLSSKQIRVDWDLNYLNEEQTNK